MALSNKSVLYLNYPTQVLFKNGKLIPVMLVGRAYFGKKYTPLHYTAVITITIGLMTFSVGDSLANATFNSQGILASSFSTFVSHIFPNYRNYSDLWRSVCRCSHR